MLAAAERGKIRINELRDDLVGDLRIATTPELGAFMSFQHYLIGCLHIKV
jgi:hypothetical protein